MKQVLLFVFLSLTITGFTYGQIAIWNFDDTSNGDDSSPTVVAPGATATDVAISGAAKKAFINGSPSSGKAYNSRNWNADGSQSDSKYIQVCVSPNSGNTLRITTIKFDAKASGTGPNSIEVRLTTDGTNFESLGAASVSSSFANKTFAPSTFPLFVSSGSACFRIYGSGASSTAGTFAMDNLIIQSSVLPIELDYFDATNQANHVNISWRTLTELNNDYMQVERSRNGKDFTPLTKVVGAGTTQEPQNYSFVDKSPLPGVSYYRLKQVDYDGAFEYHQIAQVEVKTDRFLIQAYPNVAQDMITLTSSQRLKAMGEYEIYNLSGQLVQSGQIEAGNANTELVINTLNTGIYTIKMQLGSDFATTRFYKK